MVVCTQCHHHNRDTAAATVSTRKHTQAHLLQEEGVLQRCSHRLIGSHLRIGGGGAVQQRRAAAMSAMSGCCS